MGRLIHCVRHAAFLEAPDDYDIVPTGTAATDPCRYHAYPEA